MSMTKNRERPILFNADMVRAILEGRKTQTRRPVKPPPGLNERIEDMDVCNEYPGQCFSIVGNSMAEVKCPYGQPGDRLWVRESGVWNDLERGEGPFCAATDDIEHMKGWIKPSIHMPRWASRITLEIVSVRVERVQEISDEEAKTEGVPRDEDSPWENFCCPSCHGDGVHPALGHNLGITEIDCTLCDTPRKRFELIWNSIYGKGPYAWEKNPWVWVVEFKRI